MNLIFKVSFSANNIKTNKFMFRYNKDKEKIFKVNIKNIERLYTKMTIILITDFSSTATKNKDNGVTLTCSGKASLNISCKTIIQK